MGGVDQEPLGADRLHPRADVADERGQPQPPEDRLPKGAHVDGADCRLLSHDLARPLYWRARPRPLRDHGFQLSRAQPLVDSELPSVAIL